MWNKEKGTAQNRVRWCILVEDLQYCAKVLQAKCVNFVLCSCDFSTKVRLKVRVKFHDVSSANSLEQRAIFLRNFIQPKKICEHKR